MACRPGLVLCLENVSLIQLNIQNYNKIYFQIYQKYLNRENGCKPIAPIWNKFRTKKQQAGQIHLASDGNLPRVITWFSKVEEKDCCLSTRVPRYVLLRCWLLVSDQQLSALSGGKILLWGDIFSKMFKNCLKAWGEGDLGMVAGKNYSIIGQKPRWSIKVKLIKSNHIIFSWKSYVFYWKLLQAT